MSLPRLGVSLGLIKKLINGVQLSFPFLGLILGRLEIARVTQSGFGCGVDGQYRPHNVQGSAGFYCHIFAPPTCGFNEAGSTGHHAAERGNQRMSISIGPGHWNQLRIRINGNPRLDVRSEFPHFRGVLRGTNGIDLSQSQ